MNLKLENNNRIKEIVASLEGNLENDLLKFSSVSLALPTLKFYHYPT